jgi:pimeloyl-ACP methyl ester carboxylesterase
LSSRTFILVHGAWHSGACWNAVVPLLQMQGFTVLAPDLPGHGTNAVPLAKITLKAYVNFLLELLDGIDGKVTLVGHSMAGLIVSEVATRKPEKIARLVYLCAYLPLDGESLFDLIALNRSHEPFTAIEMAMQISDDKRSCTIDADQIIPLFYTQAPANDAAQAKTDFSVQATLPLAAKVQLDEQAWSMLRRTYILCAQDKVIPVHHQRRMLTRQHCDVLLQLDADHSPFLSCPEQLALVLGACQESLSQST